MNKLNTKKQFREALSYIKESAKYIYTAAILFGLGTIIGFVFQDKLKFIDEILKQLLRKTLDLNPIEMIFFILQNNLQSALISIILGVFLGIFPIFSTLSNGIILGYVLKQTLEVASILIWWRLIPHGIFELPAIFISFGLGIKLGFSFFQKDPKKTFKTRFYKSANTFLMIIIPLLIIAAIIEGILIFLS